MFQIRKNMYFTCVTVGLVLLASKYRNNVLESVKQICHSIAKKRKGRTDEIRSNEDSNYRKELKVSMDKIILADSPEQCDYAVQRIRCNLSNGVLGFDCEWVNEQPASLLQLATRNGVCALFRLNKIGFIPLPLKELLTNRNLIKVGVCSFEDGKKLAKDYGCHVAGTLDLRSLANNFSLVAPKSLAALSVQYLGIEMNKVPEIRCGDWNTETLSDEQIKYASCDAYASILIFYKIMQKARQQRPLWKNLVLYLKYLQSCSRERGFFDLPNELIDMRFKGFKEKVSIHNNLTMRSNSDIHRKIGQIMERNNTPDYKSSIPARNKPLYHNCYLQAPDGETLCTCDKKKAEWYVSKQLGEVVQVEPLTVRLKFEPSGRASGEVGKYYTQEKVNQCVVCGAVDKFIRKNVVPREYRKYFPLVMKSHQSHDVLLLCPACHEVSNCQDLHLRRKLSEICDAPLAGPLPTHVHEEVPRGWKMLQSAVRVLRDSSTPIPYERQRELEMYIMQFTGQREVTPDFLNILHEQLSEQLFQKNLHKKKAKKNISLQTKTQPHGLKVVRYFENREGGLIELEKLWREHFLDTMKPKFLPDLWSVSHNQERLYIRQTENRIEPSDAKVAGIAVL